MPLAPLSIAQLTSSGGDWIRLEYEYILDTKSVENVSIVVCILQMQ